MAIPNDLDYGDTHLRKTFDSIRPMLVQACGPIAQSFDDIKELYGITAETAELELSFNFSASTGLSIAEAKQNSSITVKLVLRDDSGAGLER